MIEVPIITLPLIFIIGVFAGVWLADMVGD